MRWRVRLLRIYRNKAKGPLFTVFTMCLTLLMLSMIQTLLGGKQRSRLSDDGALENLEAIEDLISDGAEGRLDPAAPESWENDNPEEYDQLQNDVDIGRDVMEFEDGEKMTASETSKYEGSREREDVDGNLTCTTHIMFIAESQLGNLLVKYAVLYAMREKFGARVYLFPKQQRFLKQVFINLSIKQVPDRLKTADWRPVDYEDILYMLPCNRYVIEEEFLVVTDWPQDNGLQLYSDHIDDLRADLKFTPSVRRRARHYTERFRSSPNTTLVGIHIRRGDHILHTWLRHRRKLPDSDYVNKSMQYFTTMFPEVRFLAVSDDRRYLMTKLLPAIQHNVFTTDSLNQVQDMALLAACDHTIISVGTFGLFTGILAGGSIVAAARSPGTRGDPFDIQVNPPREIRDVFLWN